MDDTKKTAQVACSLTDDEFRQRRAMMRKTLLPYLIESAQLDAGLRLTFADTPVLRAKVDSFIDLERQCCGFLTFAMSPTANGLVVTIEGPPDARPVLDTFAAWTTGADHST